jgi:hypothetical protein
LKIPHLTSVEGKEEKHNWFHTSYKTALEPKRRQGVEVVCHEKLKILWIAFSIQLIASEMLYYKRGFSIGGILLIVLSTQGTQKALQV